MTAGATGTAGTLVSIEGGDDDAALVFRAQAGDRDALDQLLRRHYDQLYAVCRRLTGDDTDAADAAQEALLSVVRGLARFDGRSRFSTWAYRVAVNASFDELRRRRRRPTPTPDLARASRGEPACTGSAGDPDRVAERIDVDAALSRLAPDFRAAVVLRDLCDLDYAEIAEVLDLPPGTVRSRIARGRAALARLLAEDPTGSLP